MKLYYVYLSQASVSHDSSHVVVNADQSSDDVSSESSDDVHEYNVPHDDDENDEG